jgi:hypothetical protein
MTPNQVLHSAAFAIRDIEHLSRRLQAEVADG